MFCYILNTKKDVTIIVKLLYRATEFDNDRDVIFMSKSVIESYVDFHRISVL